ncbi:MAG: thioesterase [Deltaproteobacteria bacterium]|nr:thioesterase [Deltaproteobacteria bacterium]
MEKHLPTKEELTESLRFAPFHRWLDLRIGEITDDGLEIIMPWRPEIISNTNPKEVLSQGVKTTSTAYVHVDYHRLATSGPISAKAKILKIGRTISTAEIFVYGPDGTLLASGRGGYPCS